MWHIRTALTLALVALFALPSASALVVALPAGIGTVAVAEDQLLCADAAIQDQAAATVHACADADGARLAADAALDIDAAGIASADAGAAIQADAETPAEAPQLGLMAQLKAWFGGLF